jgi:hypothetical protein
MRIAAAVAHVKFHRSRPPKAIHSP